MNRQDFERLPKLNVGNVLMDISDIDDQSDRTLFFARFQLEGKWVTHHAYAMDQFLNVLVYDDKDILISHIRSRELYASQLVPDVVLNPAHCDFVAAEYLIDSGANVRFHDEYRPLDPVGYVGYTREELMALGPL
jgi:hypothetical protein